MPKFDFSEMQDFEDLPVGKYHIKLEEPEVRETGEESNYPNNEYWSYRGVVQDGDHEGRIEFINVMLPPYEPFTLYALAKASGKWEEEDIKSGDFEVEMEDLEDVEMVMTVYTNKKGKRGQRFAPYDPDEWDAEDSNLP